MTIFQKNVLVSFYTFENHKLKLNKMKTLTFAFLVSIFYFSCNSHADKPSPSPTESLTELDLTKYPEALQKIFTKHGSLQHWNKMNAMSYEIVKEDGNEKQFVDLKNRREKIEGNNFITGHDGKNFWLEADTSYKGNAVFYHNLIFYFYAMPFVVADEGIIYSETEPLAFDGKSYPGMRISYKANIGVAPEDEYFIHYDPETYQMAWLGYTVTYFSKEKSKKIKWINYNNWKNYNGLLLPSSMDWYKTADNKPTELATKREFAKIKISETAFKDELFAKTEKAVIVE